MPITGGGDVAVPEPEPDPEPGPQSHMDEQQKPPSAAAPPGWHNTPMVCWTKGDVLDWIRAQLPALYTTCAAPLIGNHVSGRVLVDLTEDDLIQLNIASADDRCKLLYEIALEQLRNEYDELSELRRNAADESR